MAELLYKIKNRRGLAAEWLLADPVLSAGEFGIESDTGKIKIGDGVTAWSVLPYLTDHDHDAAYAAIGHDHDEAYSGITHNHDEAYAAIDHDHEGIGDALTIKGVTVDDTDLADGRLLAYDESGDGSLVYIDPPEGGGGALTPLKAWYPMGAPRVLDLTVTDPDLKGFVGAFTDGRYGYFVPYNNVSGVGFGKVARVDLSDFSTVAVLDLTVTDPDLKGLRGGFTDGRYGYFVPYVNGSKVARVDLSDFSTVAVLDLTVTDPALVGFQGGFTDGRYGYFVPYTNSKVARVDLSDFSTVTALEINGDMGPMNKCNSGFTDGRYGYFPQFDNGMAIGGLVARVDLSSFASNDYINLQNTDIDLKGFQGSFTDGTYGYFIPGINGKVARVDLSDFSTIAVLDLALTDAALVGFWGGFTDGRYGYFVPYINGKVARVDLSDFSTVEVLDLALTDAALSGFQGGFTDGRYGYCVPNGGSGSEKGKVARIQMFNGGGY